MPSMPVSTLELDLGGARRPLRRVWEFGFNTCHAPLAMRSDLQAHMREAAGRLGMRYWRCHGTLSDDVGILTRDARGRAAYAFSGLKRIVDAGLAAGVKPFFELSFMPEELVRDPSRTVTHYRGPISPPRDFARWRELVSRTVRFLAETYGKKEVRTWYFEVWNEPNIPFWDGTQAEYFRLYREAAEAVKAVDPGFRVGGPATARAAWVADLLAFCRKGRVPLDFVSTHIYPSDVAFVEGAAGEVKLLGLDFLHRHFARVRAEADAAGGPRLPVIWGEWNSSAGPLAANHDDANNAALVSGALAGIARHGDGSLFWNLSDVYEECQYHFLPFHGGYGLYTVDGIPKSAARAFELFHGLEAREVPVRHGAANARRGILASCDPARRKVRAILWNHREEGRAAAAWDAEVDLGRFSAVRAETHRIEPGRGSAYEAWKRMGMPANLSVPQRRRLLAASEPKRAVSTWSAARSKIGLRVPAGTALRLDLDLKPL